MSATPHLLKAGNGDKRFAFIWMREVRLSDLHATTKLVLFALGTFMDPDGGNCFPSTTAIAAGCSLTRKAVMPHLREAEKRGFVQIAIASDPHGKGWRRHRYVPVLGAIAVTEGDSDMVVTEGDSDAATVSEGGDPGSAGGHLKGHQVVTDGDSTYAITDSKTYPDRQADFSKLWSEWPDVSRPDSREVAAKLFGKIEAADWHRVISAAEVYRTVMIRRGKPARMILFLRDRAWMEFDDAPPIDKDGDFVITPLRPEWKPWLDDIRRKNGDRGVQVTMDLKPPLIVRKQRWPDGSEDHRQSAAERAA